MDIKDRVLELLEKNFEKDKCIKILKNEFSWVNVKYIDSVYRQAKKDWCTAKHEDYLTVRYAGPNPSKKELKRFGEVEMSNKENVKVSNLKVVRKEIEIQGGCGSYLVTQDGVKAGDKKFKTLEELKVYEEQELKEFAKRMAEIKSVFQYV